MAVTKRLRFEILRRDNHQCRYCGAKAPDVPLRVDHVIPIALGGSDDPTNLVTACEPCNTGKSSIPLDAPLVEAVANDAIRWGKALQHAAELDRAKRSSDNQFVWTVINEIGLNVFTHLDRDYERTILQFRDLGLDLDDMTHAIETVHSRGLFGISRWKYFCGICWSMIKERQQTARSILDAEVE